MSATTHPPLSVLDLMPVSTGVPPTQAIRASGALAQRVEQLGYERFWVAEHHNMPGIASSAPEVMIGHLAGITRRIRVGAGGIMLPNHAPLRVLEVFRTLEALYPGRIDLGIGRAPGTDPVTSSALRRARGGEVNEQLAELMAFATAGFPEGHPFRSIEAMPSDVPVPPIWMLGSTSAGAGLAAKLGLGFAFAGHFSMGEAHGALQTYRSNFVPSAQAPVPRVIMAVNVVCGQDDPHAELLAGPLRLAFARMATGQRGPLPTVEEARAYPFSRRELAAIEHFSEGSIVGGPDRVRRSLEDLVRETDADELMISTIVPNHEERVASYERLAEAWGLDGRFGGVRDSSATVARI